MAGGAIWDAGSWSVLRARFFGQEDVLVGRGVLPEGRLQQSETADVGDR